MIVKAAPAGIVTNQEAMILPTEDQSKCSAPLAKPTPITPPTSVCVVDIGNPK